MPTYAVAISGENFLLANYGGQGQIAWWSFMAVLQVEALGVEEASLAALRRVRTDERFAEGALINPPNCPPTFRVQAIEECDADTPAFEPMFIMCPQVPPERDAIKNEYP